LKRLSISEEGLNVYVSSRDEALQQLSGNYLKHDKLEDSKYHEPPSSKPRHPGALRVVYRLMTADRGDRWIDARIESMDVFGNVW